jgi:hypothetical protein
MLPFEQFPESSKPKIKFVLTDIDDTLTCQGRLPWCVFEAMERLQSNGIHVIPVTGRPAGWCDHIARMWPVDGVIGENGAFYFRYNSAVQKMIRRYWKTDLQREADRIRLEKLKKTILKQIPDARISADQAYREADLAIDFCEDVIPPLSFDTVTRIVHLFESAGAQAKISSIHVNGWFGEYDKLKMAQVFFQEEYGIRLDDIRDQVVFSGDSPNDCPMFAYFLYGVGVANIRHFKGKLTHEPGWITRSDGGVGFAEMVSVLLSYIRSKPESEKEVSCEPDIDRQGQSARPLARQIR